MKNNTTLTNNSTVNQNTTNIVEIKSLVSQTSDVLKAILISFLVFILSIIFLNSQAQTVQTYTSSGTWVCPAGVTSIKVECWGGGGAGGGANQTTTGGGGGGGGSYNVNTFAVVPGIIYPFTVGSGGVGTIYSGVSGGTTVFGTLTAPGGTGGSAASSPASSAAGGAGAVAGSGGSGGAYIGGTGSSGSYINATTYQSGGAGGGAGSTGNGGNAAGLIM